MSSFKFRIARLHRSTQRAHTYTHTYLDIHHHPVLACKLPVVREVVHHLVVIEARPLRGIEDFVHAWL